MAVRRVAGIAPRYNNGLVTGTCRDAVDHVAVPARAPFIFAILWRRRIQTYALFVLVTVSKLFYLSTLNDVYDTCHYPEAWGLHQFFENTFKAFSTSVFTALHVMQTRYCEENSVRLSVRPSVCHTRVL